MDYSKLKGRIIEKFNSQSTFAEEIGTSRQVVSYKLKGKRPFTQKDIMTWSKALELSADEIGTFFFSINVQESEK